MNKYILFLFCKLRSVKEGLVELSLENLLLRQANTQLKKSDDLKAEIIVFLF